MHFANFSFSGGSFSSGDYVGTKVDSQSSELPANLKLMGALNDALVKSSTPLNAQGISLTLTRFHINPSFAQNQVDIVNAFNGDIPSVAKYLADRQLNELVITDANNTEIYKKAKNLLIPIGPSLAAAALLQQMKNGSIDPVDLN